MAKKEESYFRFDFQIDQVLKELKKRKPKLVLLQFAEGIKQYSHEVVSKLESEVEKNLKKKILKIFYLNLKFLYWNLMLLLKLLIKSKTI